MSTFFAATCRATPVSSELLETLTSIAKTDAKRTSEVSGDRTKTNKNRRARRRSRARCYEHARAMLGRTPGAARKSPRRPQTLPERPRSGPGLLKSAPRRTFGRLGAAPGAFRSVGGSNSDATNGPRPIFRRFVVNFRRLFVDFPAMFHRFFVVFSVRFSSLLFSALRLKIAT